MQLLAKLLLVVPPIDLCGHLGLDALMCGATEVMSRFCVGLVVQIIYNNRWLMSLNLLHGSLIATGTCKL